MSHILVVDDLPMHVDYLREELEALGFEVSTASAGEACLERVNQKTPDLILLDYAMPGMDGLSVLKILRAEEAYAALPVILLTARKDVEDRVEGLDAGADDYITKPFSVNELVARVKAVLRRIRPMFVDEVLTYKGIVIDLVSHSASRDGETLHLGPTEFNLLAFFMENIGRVFSREQLLNHVWKNEAHVEPRTVDVHIRRLRKAINNDVKEDFIRTVRSAGYCFGS